MSEALNLFRLEHSTKDGYKLNVAEFRETEHQFREHGTRRFGPSGIIVKDSSWSTGVKRTVEECIEHEEKQIHASIKRMQDIIKDRNAQLADLNKFRAEAEATSNG